MKRLKICLLPFLIFLIATMAACGPTEGPSQEPGGSTNGGGSEPIDWVLMQVPDINPTFDLHRIVAVQATPIPEHLVTHGLDILIMGSGTAADYGNKPLAEFYKDVKPFMHDVFGVSNVFGAGPYGSPFNYYVTDYEYSQATPVGGSCNAGFPSDWAPEPNAPVDNRPAFDCNFALSTASVSLNLGFIVHKVSAQDRNRFNIFSSEYNSYAAILHELSHAGFAMSDEAPTGSGRFTIVTYANIYKRVGTPTPAVICRNTGQTACAAFSANCIQIDSTIYDRCEPPDDLTNLMLFDPQPAPGNNAGWNNYQHYFATSARRQYIYNICSKGEC